MKPATVASRLIGMRSACIPAAGVEALTLTASRERMDDLVAAADALSGIAVVAREEINRLSEADEPDEIRAAGIDAINSLCEALGVEL